MDRGVKNRFFLLLFLSSDSLYFQGFSSVSLKSVLSSKLVIFLSRARGVLTGCYEIVICLSLLKENILHNNNL